MRIYTPVPVVNRNCEAGDTLGKYAVPPGTSIIISIHTLHLVRVAFCYLHYHDENNTAVFWDVNVPHVAVYQLIAPCVNCLLNGIL